MTPPQAPVWSVLIMAAGRGPGDPMAKAFSVSHKCLVPIAGQPMLARVVAAVQGCGQIGTIGVSIDQKGIVETALGTNHHGLIEFASGDTAPNSALRALESARLSWPVLITTADHALLTPQMLDFFLDSAGRSDADVCVGLASKDTIMAAHPDTRRTYLRFGKDKVSGCNLYALKSPRALAAVKFWHKMDENRKKPWRLVFAFGPMALLRFAAGALDLKAAFAIASAKLNITAQPVLLPFARAAIDVDKPQDKELVENILKAGNSSPQ